MDQEKEKNDKEYQNIDKKIKYRKKIEYRKKDRIQKKDRDKKMYI